MRQGKSNVKQKLDESLLPDGGWGWMIVLGVAVTNMFNQALISVFGLLFGQHLEEMGHETSGVALVSNVNNMVMCFSGLITGPVLNRFSCRSVSLVGSFLTFIGLIMCSFATSITEILVYYSFFGGLGLGLIYPASFVAIKTYFSTRRGRAVGISMAGTGIGQMVMPQIVRVLLDEFGFAWTVRIVAVLCLHGVVGSLLYQPVKWHIKKIAPATQQLLIKTDSRIIEEIKFKPVEIEEKSIKKNASFTVSIDEKNEKLFLNGKNDVTVCNGAHKILDEQKDTPPKISRCEKLSKIFAQLRLPLLLDPSFFNLCIGVAFVHTSGVAFGMIYPFLLMEGPVLTLSRTNTALCMSLLSAADIIARLSVPTITFYLGMSCRVTFMWGALLLAGARFVVSIQDTLSTMIAASILCGYIRAITVINQNMTVSDHCQNAGIDDQLPSALGLMMVVKGVCVISFGQLLGWIRDYTQSYTLFIYGTNILLIFVFITWMIEWSVNRLRKTDA